MVINRLYRPISELRLALDTHQAQVERLHRVRIARQPQRGYSLVIPEQQAES